MRTPLESLLDWEKNHPLIMKQKERDELKEQLKIAAPQSHRAIELRAVLKAKTKELLELETNKRKSD